MTGLSKNHHWFWLLASLALFGLACLMPAIEFEKIRGGERDWQWGIGLALIGWIAILVSQFGWYANLPLALGWLFLTLRSTRAAAICGAVALVIALHTIHLMYRSFAAGDDHTSISTVSRLGPGFFLWLGSMVVLMVGAVVSQRAGKAVFPLPRSTAPSQ